MPLLAKGFDQYVGGFATAEVLLSGNEVAVTNSESLPSARLDEKFASIFFSSSRYAMASDVCPLTKGFMLHTASRKNPLRCWQTLSLFFLLRRYSPEESSGIPKYSYAMA